MSVLFDDASSQYLITANVPVSSAPLSMACWAYRDADVRQTAVCIGDTVSSNNYFQLRIRANVAPRYVTMTATSAAADGRADTSTQTSLNTWHHLAGVCYSTSSRAAFLDGGGKGTNSTASTPAGLDNTVIGRNERNPPTDYFSGMIAEVGIWNIALTDDEVAILAAGYSPLFVRPANLVFYAPLMGRNDPARELINGYGLTWTNAPITAEHPAIRYPSTNQAPLSGGGLVIPLFMNYYRRRRVN